jgi:hypothetical protein
MLELLHQRGLPALTRFSICAWVIGNSTGGVLPACVASLVDTSGHRRVAANTCLGVLHQHGLSALNLHIGLVSAWGYRQINWGGASRMCGVAC